MLFCFNFARVVPFPLWVLVLLWTNNTAPYFVHVDRFLSAHVVPKETLQLVGAVALMSANNHFCKLPHQDGERPVQEHGLNHAEDIVYWTDGTYTITEVLTMEARLLYGLEVSQLDSPLDYFAHVSCGAGLPDETVSLAAELLILCTREYPLLRLHSRLLVACAVRVAVRNSPDDLGVVWSESLAARCGYPTAVISEMVRTHLAFLSGLDVSCRRLASGRRERSLRVRLCDELG